MPGLPSSAKLMRCTGIAALAALLWGGFPGRGEAADAIRALAQRGVKIVVAALSAGDLLKAADAAREAGITLLNVKAPDDALRNEQCRANLLHTFPSHAMLTDALAQYLAWKKWQRWF